jgi:hypothetical protein
LHAIEGKELNILLEVKGVYEYGCVLLYLKRPHSGNISLRSEARETNQISTNNMVDDDGKQAGLFLMKPD